MLIYDLQAVWRMDGWVQLIAFLYLALLRLFVFSLCHSIFSLIADIYSYTKSSVDEPKNYIYI